MESIVNGKYKRLQRTMIKQDPLCASGNYCMYSSECLLFNMTNKYLKSNRVEDKITKIIGQ